MDYRLTRSVPRTASRSPLWHDANGLFASSSLILGIDSGTSSTSARIQLKEFNLNRFDSFQNLKSTANVQYTM